MEKPTPRVNKTRQDREVTEWVAQLLRPDSFIRDLPPKQVIAAFTQLSLGSLGDLQDFLEKTGEPSDALRDPAVQQQEAHNLGVCAWEHFRHHAHAKFRLALTELMHESISFSYAIHAERSGFTGEYLNDARPRREDLEQNVLRHELTRLNALPLHWVPEAWVNEEEDREERALQFRIARLIFKDMSLWTYDHVAVMAKFTQLIRSYVGKHENPDEEAEFWGREAAELVWEHIDGATQTMLLILVNWVLMLTKYSATKRLEIEVEPHEVKQIQPSKEQLKNIAETLIGLWIDNLPFDWRSTGRPVKKTNELAAARERLAQELHELAAAITAEGGRVTWDTLAMRRKRPPNEPQSGDALRKEAAALKLSLRVFKPEKN